ncbi:MAG: aminotransferase class V-fold PLP-dependent enzyme [Gammaproteobacteria bacterium]|nr:aminotransferase class V-fold PLP-dependent enzyme [Gammaproteobacteria bacterium]
MIARRNLLKGSAGLPLEDRWYLASLTSARAYTAFGFAADRVPMNAANLCPMPSAISAAVERYSRELDRDMSAPNRRRIEAMKETARSGIAGQLGTAGDEIAIVRNTSEANSIVVQGLALRSGDEVLLWDQNHPSNALAWEVRAAREGFKVRYFAVPLAAQSIGEVVDGVSAALGPRTRMVSFTHISNITGFRLPAAEICAELRRRRPDLFIHIDGAQTWGVRDVNLAEWDCDSFSGSAHKWYMGPRETGMLYVRRESQEAVAPVVVSIPWGNDVEPSVAGARRYEALGQRDDASIAALAETVAWHGALTPAFVAHRATAVADRLRAALHDIDVPLVSPGHADFRSNVIILAASANNRGALAERVFEDSGVIPAPTGGLRLSPHIYNTAEHVERVVGAVGRVRDKLG